VKASLRAALARGAERLRAAGIESARLDARVLLAEALGRTPDDVLLCDEARADQLRSFEVLLARRANREPLAYITGHKEFWSLDFAVGPGVLVPRPESETLVEQALLAFPDSQAPLRVLDMGTGTGCLLIAFLANRVHAAGIGVDASPAALAYARRNAIRHRLDERCEFVQAEWTASERAEPGQRGTRSRGGAEHGLARLGGFPPLRLRGSACESFGARNDERFDVILVNPPYLTDGEFDGSEPEIREHEPRAAFAAGIDGLDALRALSPLLEGLLTRDGLAFVEIGAGQAVSAGEILAATGLELERVVPDLSGIPRCLVIGRAGGWQPNGAKKNSVGKKPVTG
jgi:release factor glutamine methyltransferase